MWCEIDWKKYYKLSQIITTFTCTSYTAHPIRGGVRNDVEIRVNA